MEVVETPNSLRELPRGVPHPQRVLQCTVTQVIATRPREYVDGMVLTICGTVRMRRPRDAVVPVRLHFYDAWATAASFAECGDVLLLTGFSAVDVPVTDAEAKKSHTVTVLSPLPSCSTLRVLQRGEHDDAMEVAVWPSCFDAPRVRVLSAAERARYFLDG